jgi:hypothetical protein
MGIKGIKVQVRNTTELPRPAMSSRQAPAGEWDQAVHAAAVRLNEGWVLPETRCHPAVAEELAAFLCAYGV